MDSVVPWILLCASSIFMGFKQYINVVQLITASKRLADGDVEMRKNAGLPRKSRS
jgi:CDP-diacylglycerol--inositol 3-phosphatidyltransferase